MTHIGVTHSSYISYMTQTHVWDLTHRLTPADKGDKDFKYLLSMDTLLIDSLPQTNSFVCTYQSCVTWLIHVSLDSYTHSCRQTLSSIVYCVLCIVYCVCVTWLIYVSHDSYMCPLTHTLTPADKGHVYETWLMDSLLQTKETHVTRDPVKGHFTHRLTPADRLFHVSLWSKEPPPPGGVSYWLCSLIKKRV